MQLYPKWIGCGRLRINCLNSRRVYLVAGYIYRNVFLHMVYATLTMCKILAPNGRRGRYLYNAAPFFIGPIFIAHYYSNSDICYKLGCNIFIIRNIIGDFKSRCAIIRSVADGNFLRLHSFGNFTHQINCQQSIR